MPSFFSKSLPFSSFFAAIVNFLSTWVLGLICSVQIMSKQEIMKMQTCVLKVNIQCHCDGCKSKIKKLLQKVEGVYNTQINAEQGKVTVTGNVDPVKLIKKLEKSGKHAELWGPAKGFNNFQNALNNQFKNMQISNGKAIGGGGKDNKAQKGGKGGQQQQMQQFKGSKDVKLPQKEHKSVKFNMQDDYIDASDDEFDGDFYDDEFDDEDFDDEDEEFGHSNGHGKGQFGGQQIMANKMMPMGMMGQYGGPPKGGGGGNGGKGKKGGGDFEIPVVMKGKNGQKGGDGKGKNGKNGKSKGGNEKKEGKDNDKEKSKDGKSGPKTGIGAFLSFGRKSKNGREKDEEFTFTSNKGGNNNNNGHGGKKGNSGKNNGFELHDFNKPKQMYPGINVKGGSGGGGQMGRQMPPQMGGGYGGMGGFPAVQGLPMNGPYQGMMGPGPGLGPYSQQQQQYMAMMTSQQGQNGNNMYHPAMYGRNPAVMNYMGPPPPMPRHPMADPYTHMFSDENAESCSVM